MHELSSDIRFDPRGGTPLYDALGRAIVDTGARFKRMAEKDRPSKVVFMVITDGEENASKEFTKAKIAEMVKTQQYAYSWDFCLSRREHRRDAGRRQHRI